MKEEKCFGINYWRLSRSEKGKLKREFLCKKISPDELHLDEYDYPLSRDTFYELPDQRLLFDFYQGGALLYSKKEDFIEVNKRMFETSKDHINKSVYHALLGESITHFAEASKVLSLELETQLNLKTCTSIDKMLKDLSKALNTRLQIKDQGENTAFFNNNFKRILSYIFQNFIRLKLGWEIATLEGRYPEPFLLNRREQKKVYVFVQLHEVIFEAVLVDKKKVNLSATLHSIIKYD